jgi:ribose-phosphate pyrophosphokinase
VEAMNLIGSVEGQDVLIVDDMTETAGTLCAAAKILAANGARRIFAGVSHAVLGDLGRQRIEESAIEKLLTTNSTPVANEGKVEVVDLSPLFGEAIMCIHEGKSVSSLFDIKGPEV